MKIEDDEYLCNEYIKEHEHDPFINWTHTENGRKYLEADDGYGYKTKGFDDPPIEKFCKIKRIAVQITYQKREMRGISLDLFDCSHSDRNLSRNQTKASSNIKCDNCKGAGGKKKRWGW